MRRNYLGRRCRMQQYYNHPWSSIWLSNISIALQQTRGDAGKYEDWQSFAVNFASEAAASASLLGKFELAIAARVTVAKALILSNRSSAALVYAALTADQPLKVSSRQDWSCFTCSPPVKNEPFRTKCKICRARRRGLHLNPDIKCLD